MRIVYCFANKVVDISKTMQLVTACPVYLQEPHLGGEADIGCQLFSGAAAVFEALDV